MDLEEFGIVPFLTTALTITLFLQIFNLMVVPCIMAPVWPIIHVEEYEELFEVILTRFSVIT